jgi:hypothetical protein
MTMEIKVLSWQQYFSVLVWWLNLQLSVQSVPITTKNVSSNTAQCEVC